MCERPVEAAGCHSRQGSGDGLLLSVSALAGPRGAMGQGASAADGEEGGEEEAEAAICCSSCAELEEKLVAARANLAGKEEQVEKLSRIRDEVEAELEELTASLFQVLGWRVLSALRLRLGAVSCLILFKRDYLVLLKSQSHVLSERCKDHCRRRTAWWPRRWPSVRGLRRHSQSPT
jgi:hypothetical protein